MDLYLAVHFRIHRFHQILFYSVLFLDLRPDAGDRLGNLVRNNILGVLFLRSEGIEKAA